MLTCVLSSHISSHCGITYLHLYIIVPGLLNIAYCLILYHSNHFLCYFGYLHVSICATFVSLLYAKVAIYTLPGKHSPSTL